jgi:hypothetical protein
MTEGNAPIQDPMEFGEMANWTPLDGSEGLKRKRAEAMELIEGEVHCGKCNENVEDDPIYAEFILRCDCGHILYRDTSDGPYDMVDYYGAESFEAQFYTRTRFGQSGICEVDGCYQTAIMRTDDGCQCASIQGFWRCVDHHPGHNNDGLYVVTGQTMINMGWDGESPLPSVEGLNAESFEAPSATIPVNYPKHLQPDWQKTPASSKKMAKEMRQALETEDPAARHAAIFAMQDKYGDYWNQQSFNDAFKKEMEGSEPSWVKPVATALGFGLGFLGIKQLKKEL